MHVVVAQEMEQYIRNRHAVNSHSWCVRSKKVSLLQHNRYRHPRVQHATMHLTTLHEVVHRMDLAERQSM